MPKPQQQQKQQQQQRPGNLSTVSSKQRLMQVAGQS
jgi:hypothetical protein